MTDASNMASVAMALQNAARDARRSVEAIQRTADNLLLSAEGRGDPAYDRLHRAFYKACDRLRHLEDSRLSTPDIMKQMLKAAL